MDSRFKDREHLVRLAALFAVAFVAFMVVRTIFVPKDFGRQGHYRLGAVAAAAARAPRFAGRAACLDCHPDMGDTLSAGAHRTVGCEACHGPLAEHAADPAASAARKPDPRVLCATCHAEDIARPRSFPQIAIEDHAGEVACTECHRSHTPRIPQEGQ